MLDIDEFREKRTNIFNNRPNFQSIAYIKKNLEDLEILCANERSNEVIDLLEFILDSIEKKAENELLFSIYWMYFIQTYLFVQRIKQTEIILSKMEEIAKKTDEIRYKAIVFDAKSLLLQLKGKKKESLEQIKLAKATLNSNKQEYPETYYAILYAYTYFLSFENKNYKDASKRMKLCFDYYYNNSKNSLGMIKSLSSLLRFYAFSDQKEETDRLLEWTFNDEKIQDKVSSTQAILLYLFAGTISALRYRIDDALIFLDQAYEKIKEENLQLDMMYEFSSTIRLLSRFYSFQGNFQKSYELLIELTNFMEEKFVKLNYIQKSRRKVFFSSYYTLLFIYSQLNIDINNIQDESLQKLHNYINEALSKSKIPLSILLEDDLDQEKLNDLLQDEKSEDKEEVSFLLHQVVAKHESYLTPDEFEDRIDGLRDYVYDPLYLDILLAKIYLSKGNYDAFHNTIKKFSGISFEEQEPTVNIWKKIFFLLADYLKNPEDRSVLTELNKLEVHCKRNNFNKIAEEIYVYQKLIASKRTIGDFEERFKQTAFMDVFNEESRKMVLDYLDFD
ncbi:MAG: hypothetical protein ACTSQF_14260 [Candidatus Heimdallarchaeaceae archaeon]